MHPCLVYKWGNLSNFLFQLSLCVVEDFLGWGSRQPHGSGIFRACSCQHWHEKVSRSSQWPLLCSCCLSPGADLKKFPQVFLYLLRILWLSDPLQSWESWLLTGEVVTEQLWPPGEAQAQRYLAGHNQRAKQRAGRDWLGAMGSGTPVKTWLEPAHLGVKIFLQSRQDLWLPRTKLRQHLLLVSGN